MSLLVYFDTNVFDNLIKRTGGITEADEAALRAAVSSEQLTIVVSHINIRETLAALDRRPEIAKAQLNLIVRLADWDRFVRFSTQILEDDIRHFAFNGERANTPFENDRHASHIRSVVHRIIDGSIGAKELEALIREDGTKSEHFWTASENLALRQTESLKSSGRMTRYRASSSTSKTVQKSICSLS